jgi:hypothetical protein
MTFLLLLFHMNSTTSENIVLGYGPDDKQVSLIVAHPAYHSLSSSNYTIVADNHLGIARSDKPLVAVFVKIQRGRNVPSYLPGLINPWSLLPCLQTLTPGGRSEHPVAPSLFSQAPARSLFPCRRVLQNTLEGRSHSPASPSSIPVTISYLTPLLLVFEQRTH